MSIDKEKKPVKTAAKPKKAAVKAPAAKAEKPKATAKAKPAANSTPKAAPKAAKADGKPVAVEAPQATQPAARLRPTHEQIAHVAYGYFLQRHGQHGHHEDDWHRAEQELLRLL